MLRGRCKVFLIGKAGEDGVVRYTPAGTPVLRFSLATPASTGKPGAPPPPPDWHKILVVGPQASDRENAVFKGQTCYVEGTLRTRVEDGKVAGRRVTEVYVGSEGTLQVYHHAKPPAEQGAVESSRVSPTSRMNRTAPPSGSRQATVPATPEKTSKSQTDDDWLSFEGLLLNDHAELFD
jgi:single stranded DNA-binding protein